MANHLNRIAVLFAVYSFVALALSATAKPEASDAPAKKTSRGTIVQWEGQKISPETYSWLVGADNKRRWIHNSLTLKCLRDIGLPINKLNSEDLAKIPEAGDALATCGLNTMNPNESLEKGCYLQNGDYKFALLTQGLVLSKNGINIWSNKIEGDQLILQPDGNLVLNVKTGGKHMEANWTSKTSGKIPGLLALGEDGVVHLFDVDKKEIWKTQ